jgi:haloacetate dehalogenase
VLPDLRGYGESSKSATTADHEPYSKRAMARDMVALMAHFGFDEFGVAGHDRGRSLQSAMAMTASSERMWARGGPGWPARRHRPA